jgi:hypothetical protein
MAFVALLGGCSSFTAATDYAWPPDRFRIAFPDNHWQLASYIIGGNETHIGYQHRTFFGTKRNETVALSFYVPRTTDKVLLAEDLFKQTTNWFGRNGGVSVSIVQRTNDLIIYALRSEGTVGIEKIVPGRAGLYHLRYSFTSSQPWQLANHERDWLPIIKDAELIHIHPWAGWKVVPSVN